VLIAAGLKKAMQLRVAFSLCKAHLLCFLYVERKYDSAEMTKNTTSVVFPNRKKRRRFVL
tara:strand:+ start:1459 stop:1638 length:180 start_codon:yes stop_codon:yes gene_type:complete